LPPFGLGARRRFNNGFCDLVFHVQDHERGASLCVTNHLFRETK
jgi:hypothetical protein